MRSIIDFVDLCLYVSMIQLSLLNIINSFDRNEIKKGENLSSIKLI